VNKAVLRGKREKSDGEDDDKSEEEGRGNLKKRNEARHKQQQAKPDEPEMKTQSL
jgi:hypothetical protein